MCTCALKCWCIKAGDRLFAEMEVRGEEKGAGVLLKKKRIYPIKERERERGRMVESSKDTVSFNFVCVSVFVIKALQYCCKCAQVLFSNETVSVVS